MADWRGGLLRESGIRHPASGIRHLASGIRHPASGIWHPASAISHPASGIRHPASGIRHPASGIRHPASGIRHQPSAISDQPSGIRHPASAISHQPSGIWHPASGIRHLASGIRHPASGIRHPASGIWHRESGIGNRASGIGIWHRESEIRNPPPGAIVLGALRRMKCPLRCSRHRRTRFRFSAGLIRTDGPTARSFQPGVTRTCRSTPRPSAKCRGARPAEATPGAFQPYVPDAEHPRADLLRGAAGLGAGDRLRRLVALPVPQGGDDGLGVDPGRGAGDHDLPGPLAARSESGRATILENNIVQTAGSAGESIAFGVGATMPALMLLGYELEWTRVMLVAVLGGLLGILMMIPLRRARSSSSSTVRCLIPRGPPAPRC